VLLLNLKENSQRIVRVSYAKTHPRSVGELAPIYAVDGITLQTVTHNKAYLVVVQLLDFADEAGLDVLALHTRGLGGCFHCFEVKKAFVFQI
jgi:hypothetical protein